jgi:hypothetical protein
MSWIPDVVAVLFFCPNFLGAFMREHIDVAGWNARGPSGIVQWTGSWTAMHPGRNCTCAGCSKGICACRAGASGADGFGCCDRGPCRHYGIQDLETNEISFLSTPALAVDRNYPCPCCLGVRYVTHRPGPAVVTRPLLTSANGRPETVGNLA